MSGAYDYAFLTLKRVPTPHQALAGGLAQTAAALGVGGGEILAQFAPQLGWAGNEAAVLTRWAGEAGDLAPITDAHPVASARTDRLTPTLRPADADRPMAGGIYVHRWFEVDAGAVDEFVELSGQGWEHFEALFDAQIFGLFTAAPTADELEGGIARLLLITRYGDHGVWEASRDPSTEAMRIFARRQRLTRRSWAASTLIVG